MRPTPTPKGVITGSCRALEWMLPWWWMHYRMHCEYPVTFFDFGLTDMARQWCEKRGQLKMVSDIALAPISDEMARHWSARKTEDIHTARQAWFKKPFACLNTPYEETLWIDLDCQVRKNLEPLFSYYEKGFSAVKEREYNTGVMAFKKDVPLLQEWADACVTHNGSFRGDQDLLAHLQQTISPLPQAYNHVIQFVPETGEFTEANPEDFILHWVGLGKIFIRNEMAMLEQKAFMNFSLS